MYAVNKFNFNFFFTLNMTFTKYIFWNNPYIIESNKLKLKSCCLYRNEMNIKHRKKIGTFLSIIIRKTIIIFL